MPPACWFRRFRFELVAGGGRLRGSHRARRTTVQPTQLSLLPQMCPAPEPTVFPQFPDHQIEQAVVLLAHLIAKAAEAAAATARENDSE